MLKIKQAVIVEGKYDKIKLKSIIDANIITTDGFRIYNNLQKRALIKNIAEKTGIIILTDSDDAGRRIRNFIKNCIGEENAGNILNVYVPESAFGVEGTDKDVLIGALERFGITGDDVDDDDCRGDRPRSPAHDPCVNVDSRATGDGRPYRQFPGITKIDFYNDGLSGGKESRKMREYLCRRLDIPCMAANSLLECVNILTDHDGYKKIMEEYDLCKVHKKK